MNDSNKLKISVATLILVSILLAYMWNNSFFMMQSIDVDSSQKIEMQRGELTNQIYEQIDFLRNLDETPSYLFKHNLAKIVFLFSHDLPTTENLLSFKDDMDLKSVEELIIQGRQKMIFTDFDVILLSKMYFSISEKNDFFLQDLRVNNSILEKNLMSSHIAQSYLDLVEKEHVNNEKAKNQMACSRCISVCMNTYTFSTEWWKNYKTIVVERSKDINNEKTNQHAFFYAETSGLTTCEKEVCKSSCDDKCEDCVPSFAYQEV